MSTNVQGTPALRSFNQLIPALLAVTSPPLASADPTAKCSGSALTISRVISTSTYRLRSDGYLLGILKDEDPPVVKAPKYRDRGEREKSNSESEERLKDINFQITKQIKL